MQSQSDLSAVRNYERLQREGLRRSCRSCGHQWQPRNPSPVLNRCPNCSVRGQVDEVRHNHKMQRSPE